LQAPPPESTWAPQERPVAHREVVHRAPAAAASIIANCCPVHPAALAVAAAVFALLALITGLVALYAWLEPTYGVFPALSIVGGVLAVIALILISDAMILEICYVLYLAT
jgi:hypothetical protein